ncbi:hypothetical protein PR003_g17044 [Phytophthora rubi]|uniref:Uncharacterized protein n=1 Tax=Phytophthora rubi TaxID=129364 RepID=A0A6A4EK88_9STRA|nr:hypothetical protein PR003_g17044 [Phytophthora rubi]
MDTGSIARLAIVSATLGSSDVVLSSVVAFAAATTVGMTPLELVTAPWEGRALCSVSVLRAETNMDAETNCNS